MEKTHTVRTIGNPLTWVTQALGSAAHHARDTTRELGSRELETPRVQTIDLEDLKFALRKGLEDFGAARADVLFLVLLYPVIGVLLTMMVLNVDMAPMIFPMVAGFAILGPLSAVGLYEISRRREMGEPVSWRAALGILQKPQFGSVVVLGLYMMALFVLWLVSAHAIHGWTMGPEAPVSVMAFVTDVFTTPQGWAMMAIGIPVGFVFALVTLAVSAISFPLLIDRHVGLPVAVVTSIRVFRANPGPMLTWGAIVTAGLVIGSIPALVGLMVVLPVLGHATWHLYRSAVD